MIASAAIGPGIWRGACQHIEIEEFVEIVAGLLGEYGSLGQAIVRRFDVERGAVATVAVAPQVAGDRVNDDRRIYQAEELKQVLLWGSSGRVLGKGKRLTKVLGLV